MLEESIFNKLEEIIEKYNNMGTLMGDPNVIANRGEFQRMAKEQGELSLIVDKYNQYKDVSKKLKEAEELINDVSSESDIKELAIEEKAILEKELTGIDLAFLTHDEILGKAARAAGFQVMGCS